MGKQPLTIPNALVIFKEISFCGFWVSAWYERASLDARNAMFNALAVLLRDGELVSEVEQRYPLARAPEAVAHAMRPHRKGKIMLSINVKA